MKTLISTGLRNFLIVGFILICHGKTISQTQWTVYSNNPVIAMDTTYMWEAMGQPSCILHNDTIKMWYAVASGVDPTDLLLRGRIRFAWSLDGINWTHHPNNPVLDIGLAGEWDDEWLDTPEILWDGTEFKLYYYGDSTYFQGQDNTNIGLATSSDGINWTKQGIVLQKGIPGEWDGNYIESPAAYFNEQTGEYILWYQGQDTIGYISIGLATSSDGYNWQKYSENPVIPPGPYPGWDDMFVAVPSVIKSGDVFEMWYSAVKFDTQWDSVRIGYAVSLDGHTWIKYPGNPVLAPNNMDGGFWAVDVVWNPVTEEYLMWYENIYIADAQAIYLAKSPRNVLFSDNCNTWVSNDTSVVANDIFSLNAGGGEIYQWHPVIGLSDPGVPNPVCSLDSSIDYTVLIVSDSCISTEQVTISVIPDEISNNLIKENRLKVHPNPCYENLEISFYLQKMGIISLIFYNSLGDRIMVISKKKFSVGRHKIKYNVNKLPSGIYYIELISDKIMLSEKVVIRGN